MYLHKHASIHIGALCVSLCIQYVLAKILNPRSVCWINQEYFWAREKNKKSNPFKHWMQPWMRKPNTWTGKISWTHIDIHACMHAHIHSFQTRVGEKLIHVTMWRDLLTEIATAFLLKNCKKERPYIQLCNNLTYTHSVCVGLFLGFWFMFLQIHVYDIFSERSRFI